MSRQADLQKHFVVTHACLERCNNMENFYLLTSDMETEVEQNPTLTHQYIDNKIYSPISNSKGPTG